MTQDALAPSVVIVIADMGAGGAQHVASHMANHWAGQGRRVGLLTFSAPETDFFETDDRVERISIGTLEHSTTLREQIVANLIRIARMRRALRAFRGGTAVGFIGPTNVLLILASIGLSLRVIISERNDPAQQSFGGIWDRLRKLTYRYADIVSANSRGAIAALRAYVPENKLVYLPNPLRQVVGASGAQAAREPIILNVGRLHYQKGQDLLIRAFARIAQDLASWRLCIMGEGNERPRLEAIIKDLSVIDRVILLGHVEDPFIWYRRASIFAFPSRWEGTPNALIEAMSCGLPAIVSDAAPGVVAIVRDGSEGRVVPAGDEIALAVALKDLAQDEKARRRLGAQAARQVQQFLPEVVVQVWDELLWSSR